MRSITSVDPDKESHGQLSRQLRKLVANDLFADVYFEVEGKRIAGHRNILGFRSAYFKAMFGFNNAGFKESSQQNPIYIPNISYEVFMQVLNFLYTGHVDILDVSFSTAVEIIRAADQLNINKLESLILYYLNEIIDKNNVVKIYREAYEKLPVLPSVMELCYMVMKVSFGDVAESEDFCALPQDLMITIIENVVPSGSSRSAQAAAAAAANQQQQPEIEQLQNMSLEQFLNQQIANVVEEGDDSDNSLLNY